MVVLIPHATEARRRLGAHKPRGCGRPDDGGVVNAHTKPTGWMAYGFALILLACTTTPTEPAADVVDPGDQTGSGEVADGVDQPDVGESDGAPLQDTDGADAAAPGDSTEDVATDLGPDIVGADAEPSDVADVADGADGADGADTGSDVAFPKITEVTEHVRACTTPADCKIPCAQGSCIEGSCVFTPAPNACVVDVDADTVACYGDGMTDPATPCLACNANLSQSALTGSVGTLPLDGAADGVEVVDVASGGASWQWSTTRSLSGGASLYFGDPTTGTYATDKQVAATATTASLAVPALAGGKPELSFWLWLNTEETAGYDVLAVRVFDGKDHKEVWNSEAIGGTTAGVWQRIDIDVTAWAGASIQVVFAFDSVDGFVNAFEGAYVDDVSISTGCCGGAAECDDGNACSFDQCAAVEGSGLPMCSHVVKADCCNSHADCDDGQPCTVDLCGEAGGQCQHQPKPGCCLADADCDDGDACTVDACPKAGASCQHTDTCCKGDLDCASDDPCLVGSCVEGGCLFATVCCFADADCDDFNPCTIDACSGAGKCSHAPSTQPGCCSPKPWQAEFESGLEGWIPEPEAKGLVWHQTNPKDPALVKNGLGALVLGNPAGGTFSGYSGTTYYIVTSPPILLQPGRAYALHLDVQFSFKPSNTSSYLETYIVYSGKKTKISTLYANKAGWQPVDYDITAVGGHSFQIELRGRMYASSSSPSTGAGIIVDGMAAESTCEPKSCNGSAQCNTPIQCLAGVCTDGMCGYPDSCCSVDADCISGNLCVAASCKSSKCTFSAKAGCCMGDGDCNDSNACTVDSCAGPGSQCKFTPLAGCCLSSSQCDDNDECSSDTCIENACVHANLCCASDAECQDGETKCTIDKCVGQTCVHEQTGAAGCCEPIIWLNDFDTGSLMDLVLKNSVSATQGWQLWGDATLSKSGKGVLYYGNTTAKNFDFGASNGQVTTPKLLLPAGKKSYLMMWLYMDTESDTTYDKMTISVKVGTGTFKLWDKASPGFAAKKWLELKLDLSEWPGEQVQGYIDFNTSDGVANSTLGVLIDDLRFTTDCDG